MSTALQRNLPNTLTLMRLVFAAAFFAALNCYRYPDTHVLWANIAIALFIIAALTDALDGHYARKWDVISTFGRIMDPFCDKVLVMGAFIYLAGPRFVVPEWVDEGSFFTMATGVYPWMVVIILARELLVTGIRGVVESSGVKFGSMLSGKLKMILQSIAIPLILLFAINFRTGETPWAMWTCHITVYVTVAVTVWSGLPYIGGVQRIMREQAAGDSADPSS